MTCQTCAELRAKLIEALIQARLADAAQIAKEGIKHGLARD